MLEEAKDKVRQLQEAVRIFKQRRDSGEPFFGEEAKQEKDLKVGINRDRTHRKSTESHHP